MRPGLTSVIAQTAIDPKWLIECEGNYWTFGDKLTFESDSYLSKIVSSSFRPPVEKKCEPGNSLIPGSTFGFAITADKTEFSAPSFLGKVVTCKLLIDGSEHISWVFHVKSCYYSYSQLNFECEDFLQTYLRNAEFPNTQLISGLDLSTGKHAGNEKACVTVTLSLIHI